MSNITIRASAVATNGILCANVTNTFITKTTVSSLHDRLSLLYLFWSPRLILTLPLSPIQYDDLHGSRFLLIRLGVSPRVDTVVPKQDSTVSASLNPYKGSPVAFHTLSCIVTTSTADPKDTEV